MQCAGFPAISVIIASVITAKLRQPADWLLFAAILLFLAAMPMDAFCTPASCSEWPAYALLFMGWLDLYAFPRAGYVWLANPALLTAWWCMRTDRKAVAFSLALTALVLAASFLWVPEVLVEEQRPPQPVVGMALGYWLWLASCAVTFVGALLMRSRAARSDR